MANFDMTKIVNEDSEEFKNWENHENYTCENLTGSPHFLGHGIRVWKDFNSTPIFVSRLGWTNFENRDPQETIEFFRNL